jgi:hypothetical protein
MRGKVCLWISGLVRFGSPATIKLLTNKAHSSGNTIKYMEIQHLEVLVMDNGEILCEGKTIGWTDKLGKYLHPVEAK